MEVNFAGFENAVNQMGGDLGQRAQGHQRQAGRGSSVRQQRAYKIAAGYQKLDGEHALTFVRARHGFARPGLQSHERPADLLPRAGRPARSPYRHADDDQVVNSITPYIQTDLSLMDMMKTALAMKDAGSKNMYTATVGGTWINPYEVPDMAKLAVLVRNFKDGVPFDKSANIATIVNPTGATSVATATVEAGCGRFGKAVLDQDHRAQWRRSLGLWRAGGDDPEGEGLQGQERRQCQSERLQEDTRRLQDELGCRERRGRGSPAGHDRGQEPGTVLFADGDTRGQSARTGT